VQVLGDMLEKSLSLDNDIPARHVTSPSDLMPIATEFVENCLKNNSRGEISQLNVIVMMTSTDLFSEPKMNLRFVLDTEEPSHLDANVIRNFLENSCNIEIIMLLGHSQKSSVLLSNGEPRDIRKILLTRCRCVQSGRHKVVRSEKDVPAVKFTVNCQRWIFCLESFKTSLIFSV
jgi:predicted esterase